MVKKIVFSLLYAFCATFTPRVVAFIHYEDIGA
jgi:hypothetical protein